MTVANPKGCIAAERMAAGGARLQIRVLGARRHRSRHWMLQATAPDFGWAHDQVLLMTNGDYIIFAFRHGANNGFVDHLFLGHCSDGRWLYSTYHSCNMMAGVRGDDPPGSIAEFEKRYSCREFDGKVRRMPAAHMATIMKYRVWPNLAWQPTPGGRAVCFLSLLARRGCTFC